MKDYLYIKNITSLVLTFITSMIYLIFCLAFEVFSVIICQIFTNYNLTNQVLFIDNYYIYIFLLATILFISPINLSVKNWYYNIKVNTKNDLTNIFVVYKSFKNYLKSIIFCTIKLIFIILSSIILLIPSAFVISIFKFMLKTYEYSNTIMIAVLFIGVLLLIIGLIACFINYIKLNCIDFMFLSNINQNQNQK